MSFNFKIYRLFPKRYFVLLNLLQIRSFSSSDKSLLIEHLEYVTLIGINRPEKRNCIDKHTASLLTQAIEKFENDDKSRVAVLYGKGGNFCSGADLAELENLNGEELVSEGFLGPTRRFIKKPIVAGINGYAVGGGLELAAMCDLRVVEETAVLGIFGRRFGIPFLDGGSVRLVALLGLSRALDLTLSGRSLTAKEAQEWGFANRIVQCGTCLGQAINLATCIAKYPQKSLLADRKAMYNAAYKMAFDDLIKFERDNSLEALPEIKEGAKKFLAGLGRHGKSFLMLDKHIPEWELEDANKIN